MRSVLGQRRGLKRKLTRAERAQEIARRAKAVLAGKMVVFETGELFGQIRTELKRQTIRLPRR